MLVTCLDEPFYCIYLQPMFIPNIPSCIYSPNHIPYSPTPVISQTHPMAIKIRVLITNARQTKKTQYDTTRLQPTCLNVY